MKIKSKIITIYYVLVVTILATQAVQTVYQLSQSIGFGQKMSQLQQQKETLANQKMNLSRQISQTSSITKLGEEINNDFRPITTPILVSSNNSVASR